MMVFVFSVKVKSHCLGLAKTLNFSEFFKKFPFSVFLNDLEENIPNKQFLIFVFSWILRIFLLSPRISELLKQALKCRIFCYPCSFLSTWCACGQLQRRCVDLVRTRIVATYSAGAGIHVRFPVRTVKQNDVMTPVPGMDGYDVMIFANAVTSCEW